jgi:hypothetical protein
LLLVAVWVAALREADEFRVSVVFTATLGVLDFACLGSSAWR